jgi:hypothetical protein
MTSISRRSSLTVFRLTHLQPKRRPPGYTSPFHVPESGKPGIRVLQTIVASSIPRSWIIVFANGDQSHVWTDGLGAARER